MPLNEEEFISRVSLCHSVSTDAVRTILGALRSGGGRWPSSVMLTLAVCRSVARDDDGRRHV
jgi:hypothetical protein